MSKIGALVAYKGRPAQVISSTTHKYEISFSDGSSQKVREKDFRLIHPDFVTVHSDCPEVDISILNDLEIEFISLKELTEWLFDDYTSQNAWDPKYGRTLRKRLRRTARQFASGTRMEPCLVTTHR